ncbi:hypothetical protein [Mycobacterium sp. GA-2829]|uniref:hypothetical protein n=1 Tax=Mycobacterium sp. GA-2829 TaxID=1772283 RepID=UPI00073FAF30|nr:hypothetical protein [Mycobacterium sp. GA-2829]KUI22295.1 hypothetical protein AU194_06050 [Mycobacterium sp. GA-2829]
MRNVLFAAAVAGSVLTIGVAPGIASAAPTSAEPVERPLSSTEVLVSARPDVVDTEPVAVDAWSPLPSPDAIRVYFLSGTPACYGVRAVTTETADAVTVELQSGLLPEATNRLCTAKGVLAATDIALETPLGNREVLSRY